MMLASRESPAHPTLDQLADQVQRHAARGRVELFIDSDLADSSIHRTVRHAVAGRTVTEHLVGTETDLDAVTSTAERLGKDSMVLGVGGGRVIDRVKLATLAASDPACAGVLASPQRCGFVMLSDRARRHLPLIVVPTTLGTGAESSRTACLRVGPSKRLVHGGALRPDVAVLDPAATATLPSWLVVEGALEALIRVCSYYVGHHGHRGGSDRRAEELVAELVSLASVATAQVADGGTVSASVRARIGLISSRSQDDDLHEGLAPFSDKCWPLANELSSATGVRKLTAMAALTPELWRRVLDGKACWGSAERLVHLWVTVRDSVPGLLADPAAAMEHLMDDWQVDRRVPRPDVDVLAGSTARAWAHGLPMLRGVTHEELRSVYDGALPLPGGQVLSRRVREEVK